MIWIAVIIFEFEKMNFDQKHMIFCRRSAVILECMAYSTPVRLYTDGSSEVSALYSVGRSSYNNSRI